MNLVSLAEFELEYTSLVALDHGAGGQLYGTMAGRVKGERLSGHLELTNLAVRRPDNVNLPTLRGVLRLETGPSGWVEMNGLARLRQEDQARVFITSLTFRATTPEFAWLDTTFAVVEGVLDKVAAGGIARGSIYACDPTVAGLPG